MNFLKLFIVIGLLTLSACGSDDEGPRGTINDPTFTIPVSGSLAECTRSVTSNLYISSQFSTYYNSYGVLDQNIVQMNITQAPSELLSDSNYSLRFFRWTENSQGQVQVNSIPTPIYFKNKLSGQIIGSQSSNEISRSIIEGLIQTYSLSSLNISLSNFLSHYYIILTDVDYQWKAVTIAYYNSAQGTEAIASSDSLLPPFYADPNVYQQQNNSSNLQRLHPLNQYLGSGAHQSDYKRLADTICYDFFGAVRNPASVKSSEGFFATIRSFWNSVRSFLSHFFGL